MKEIGGYLELEKIGGREYYPGFLKYNLGRTAAADFLKKAGAKKVWLPYFLCASVTDTLKKWGFELYFYHIDEEFLPVKSDIPAYLRADEWLYINNAYGQLDAAVIKDFKEVYDNTLCDNTHAFFEEPSFDTATYYSVRKFFGVSDGAYLFPDRKIAPPDETDVSNTRYSHILGRFEENASAHYKEMLDTAHGYDKEPAKKMSLLTQELLGAIDYEAAAKKRSENFALLDELLGGHNLYENLLKTPKKGPFVYPMLVKDGVQIRKQLAAEKIYVPTYWSNVIDECEEGTVENNYARNMLALPVDQRYGEEEMRRVAETVKALL